MYRPFFSSFSRLSAFDSFFFIYLFIYNSFSLPSFPPFSFACVCVCVIRVQQTTPQHSPLMINVDASFHTSAKPTKILSSLPTNPALNYLFIYYTLAFFLSLTLSLTLTFTNRHTDRQEVSEIESKQVS